MTSHVTSDILMTFTSLVQKLFRIKNLSIDTSYKNIDYLFILTLKKNLTGSVLRALTTLLYVKGFTLAKMSTNFSQELIDKKNKQRLALRKEYLKQLTNPHDPHHIFDPALQRWQSMKVTRIEHFRETPKTILRGLGLVVIPLALSFYVIMKDRNEKEAAYRSGQVAYKDRNFKFV